nr:MAG TPA: hypothetical protein [Caudoviricetes sp.]
MRLWLFIFDRDSSMAFNDRIIDKKEKHGYQDNIQESVQHRKGPRQGTLGQRTGRGQC